jgi:hypothetical protein
MTHGGKYMLSNKHEQAMFYRSALENEPIRENLLGTQRQGLIERLELRRQRIRLWEKNNKTR